MSCPAHALAASRKMLAAEDVDLIREVVARLDSGATIVDVGAGSGTTALSVFAERHDVRLISIEADVDTMNWARQAVENIGAKQGWDDRVEDAVEAAERFSQGEANFIILDAGHSRKAVKEQLVAWLPKLAPKGYLLIHDYDAKDAPNYYPGVKAAVDPFISKDELQRVEQRGWSLLTQSTYGEESEKPTETASSPAMKRKPWARKKAAKKS